MPKYTGFKKRLPYFGIEIQPPIVDGKQVIHAVRNEADIINGRRADTQRCVDANCLMREGKEGGFPHPVLAAWVTKSNVFILASANARTGKYRAVRYRHHNWKHIKNFDATGRWTGPLKFSLYPPGVTRALGADKRKGRTHARAQIKGQPTGRVAVPRGIDARFITMKQWEEGMEISGKATKARA